MAKERLGKATFVQRGYGQVEPNHLSAQRTGQIYAQLPAAADIDLLENGQFVKYNYKDGVVDFAGAGEWMLVFNEVKVYREWESDQDFAMRRENYVARVYSPIDGTLLGVQDGEQLTQPRDYTGVVTPADPYEWDSTDNPFAAEWDYKGPKKMPTNTKMVPRVLKTNVGDIYTTNCIMADAAPEIGAEFAPSDTEGKKGYLVPVGQNDIPDMVWQVVKVYDLGDRQPAVKLMRIK
jgi:hypothetical protein